MARGVTPETDAAVAVIADQAGLDGAGIVAGIDSPETVARHRAQLGAASSAGVFSVPSFVTDGRPFWGNDRIVLLKHRLRKASRGAG